MFGRDKQVHFFITNYYGLGRLAPECIQENAKDTIDVGTILTMHFRFVISSTLLKTTLDVYCFAQHAMVQALEGTKEFQQMTKLEK